MWKENVDLRSQAVDMRNLMAKNESEPALPEQSMYNRKLGLELISSPVRRLRKAWRMFYKRISR